MTTSATVVSETRLRDSVPTDFAAVAISLHDHAWHPVPVIGKVPAMIGWADLNRMPWDREDLLSATADYAGRDYGCGLAAVRDVVVIDCDVLDEGLAASIATMADTIIRPTPLIRIGRAPKWVRIYRRDPANQIVSRKVHPIEVMSGSGMVVAFGRHPDTDQPYRWTDQSPLTLSADDPSIPLITSTQVNQFLAAAHAILARTHYGVTGRPPGAARRTRTAGNGIGNGIGNGAAALPYDLHQRLRLEALRMGFERAVIGLLAGAHEGIRHATMWAVVSSAAGRGFPENRLIALFERHFAGWDGVTREAFAHAIHQCFHGDHRHE
jgi:hypothetical protein